MGNSTCPVHFAQTPPPLFVNGTLTFQAHQVGWIACAFFTVISCAVSWWLINKHLMYYTNRGQQRNIVRLLFMVPIYSIITFLSYLFYTHASPIVLIRDCYEAFLLSSFFYLLLQYLSPNPDEQKEVFRKVVLEKWIIPLGFIKWKPDGLYFLQIMKWGVLQYCVVRPVTTLASVILNYMGLYCEDSWGFGFGHLYLTIIVSLSVTVAMYCLLQFYFPIAKPLAPHKPLLKLFSIKAVVFLTFWQSTFLGVLSTFGVVKDQKYMTADEINVGISALLQTFEMVLFAFLHLKAFTYLPYRPADRSKTTNRWQSLAHAFDFRDLAREMREGVVYMWCKMRGIEPESGGRHFHLEQAMGRSRGLTTYHGPSTPFSMRDALEDRFEGGRLVGRSPADVERWLAMQAQAEEYSDYSGIGHEKMHVVPDKPRGSGGHVKQKSWWRNMYERVSTHQPADEEKFTALPPARISSRAYSKDADLDDDPPKSIISMHSLRRKNPSFDHPPPIPLKTVVSPKSSPALIPMEPLPPKVNVQSPSPKPVSPIPPPAAPLLPISSSATTAPAATLAPPSNRLVDRHDSLLKRVFAASLDGEADTSFSSDGSGVTAPMIPEEDEPKEIQVARSLQLRLVKRVEPPISPSQPTARPLSGVFGPYPSVPQVDAPSVTPLSPPRQVEAQRTLPPQGNPVQSPDVQAATNQPTIVRPIPQRLPQQQNRVPSLKRRYKDEGLAPSVPISSNQASRIPQTSRSPQQQAQAGPSKSPPYDLPQARQPDTTQRFAAATGPQLRANEQLFAQEVFHNPWMSSLPQQTSQAGPSVSQPYDAMRQSHPMSSPKSYPAQFPSPNQQRPSPGLPVSQLDGSLPNPYDASRNGNHGDPFVPSQRQPPAGRYVEPQSSPREAYVRSFVEQQNLRSKPAPQPVPTQPDLLNDGPRGEYPRQGPPRPQGLVMPAPLSPARFPGSAQVDPLQRQDRERRNPPPQAYMSPPARAPRAYQSPMTMGPDRDPRFPGYVPYNPNEAYTPSIVNPASAPRPRPSPPRERADGPRHPNLQRSRQSRHTSLPPAATQDIRTPSMRLSPVLSNNDSRFPPHPNANGRSSHNRVRSNSLDPLPLPSRAREQQRPTQYSRFPQTQTPSSPYAYDREARRFSTTNYTNFNAQPPGPSRPW